MTDPASGSAGADLDDYGCSDMAAGVTFRVMSFRDVMWLPSFHLIMICQQLFPEAPGITI